MIGSINNNTQLFIVDMRSYIPYIYIYIYGHIATQCYIHPYISIILGSISVIGTRTANINENRPRQNPISLSVYTSIKSNLVKTCRNYYDIEQY